MEIESIVTIFMGETVIFLSGEFGGDG